MDNHKYETHEIIDLKVVQQGNSGAGKTSIINRYITESFKTNMASTNGAMFFSKEINHNDNIYKLAIWDTAGQERYKSITPLYYKDANGVILVCDASERDKAQDGIQDWSNELHKNASKKFPAVCICGNKVDMMNDSEYENMKEELDKFALNKEYDLVMTSAKTGEGINDAFIKVIESFTKNQNVDKHLAATRERKKTKVRSQLISSEEMSTKKKGCC